MREPQELPKILCNATYSNYGAGTYLPGRCVSGLVSSVLISHYSKFSQRDYEPYLVRRYQIKQVSFYVIYQNKVFFPQVTEKNATFMKRHQWLYFKWMKAKGVGANATATECVFVCVCESGVAHAWLHNDRCEAVCVCRVFLCVCAPPLTQWTLANS